MNARQPRVEPARWLPHGAAMVLLDDVTSWDDEQLHAISDRHRTAAHPFADDGGNVAAAHLLEYAAQAAALHIGLRDAEISGRLGAGQPGVIAFARELRFACARLSQSDPTLRLEVRRRAFIPGGVAYAFAARFVDAPASLLAEGVFGVVIPGSAGTPSAARHEVI